MSKSVENRLFVPLTLEAFNWFKLGKSWEIRKLNVGQYNLKNIRVGRRTELRMGYQKGQSIWGKIVDVKIFDDALNLTKEIPFKMAIPVASNAEDAKSYIEKYVGMGNKIIAFQLKLDNE